MSPLAKTEVTEGRRGSNCPWDLDCGLMGSRVAIFSDILLGLGRDGVLGLSFTTGRTKANFSYGSARGRRLGSRRLVGSKHALYVAGSSRG